MNDDIGINHLLQSGTKGGNEMMRQVRNKSHRVRDNDRLSAGQIQGTRHRVKGGKQLIRSPSITVGQAIEERGFAGIGVSHQ